MENALTTPASGGTTPVPHGGGSGGTQYITFTVGDEEYGVDIMDVREIKGWTPTTRLPNAPGYVHGVINLRGIMVPVFDLRARFGQGATEPTKTHVVVIVTVATRVIGILVDTVSDILAIDREMIQAVPKMDLTVDADYLAGLVTIAGRMVALLTLGRLFDVDGADVTDAPRLAEATH